MPKINSISKIEEVKTNIDTRTSVLFRNLKSMKELIKKTISEIAAPHVKKGKIKINFGKKVIEIKPNVKWNKGKVVLWLLARQQFMLGDRKISPIYIGDDSTDEDAFKALKNKGLTIFVGKPRKSYAQFYLRDTGEVLKFLKQILSLRKNTVCRNK